MAAETPVRDSETEGWTARGLLFRIGTRAGAFVFTGVLAMALRGGLDPTIALLRALLALTAITACGWVAEQVVAAAWRGDTGQGTAPPDDEDGDDA